MLRSRVVLAISLAIGALAFTGVAFVPQVAEAKAKDEKEEAKPAHKLTPKVQKALKAAQDAMQKQDWATAAAKVAEAEVVEKRTDFDNYQIDEFRVAVAANNKDMKGAAEIMERMLASGFMTPEQTQQRLGHVASIYSQLGDYPKALDYAKKWQEASGGSNLDAQLITADAYYRTDKYDEALVEMQKAMDIAAASGQPVKEPWLQIMLQCYAQKNDEAHIASTLEQLVRSFPKQDYWKQLLGTLHAQEESDDRVTLHTYRLMSELNLLPTPDDYVEMAELANEQGFPGEAVKVMDEGFANKTLERSKDVARVRSRQQEFKKTADADRKSLANDEKDAMKSRTGEPDAAVGIAYLSYDQYDKAVESLQRGIQKGGLKRPDEAQIMLGRALLKMNRTDEATKAFAAVPDSSKLARLARLWAIYAEQKNSAAGA